MGQAKTRRENDPLYGKASTKLRGLIISNPSEIKDNSFKITHSNLEPQDLRSSLLYWDRLSWPECNVIKNKLTKDEEFLLDAGILSRPQFRFSGTGSISEIYKDIPLLALNDHEKTQPGVWSLGNSSNSLLIHAGASPEQSGAIMRLYNAVPVPSNEVPLAEILEFKHKRRSELLLFRSYFESLASEIEGASDSVDLLNKRLSEVDAACSDLLKVTREYQLPFMLSNMSASFDFNIAKAASAAAKTWVALEKMGLEECTKTVSAIGAAVNSQFSIKADISLRSIKRSKSPYRYAYLAQRDLG